MDVVFDDEYLRQMMELVIGGFVGWMQLQEQGVRMCEAFNLVMQVFERQAQDYLLSSETYQNAYDAASWLSGIAREGNFEEMAAILDAAASRFSTAMVQAVVTT